MFFLWRNGASAVVLPQDAAPGHGIISMSYMIVQVCGNVKCCVVLWVWVLIVVVREWEPSLTHSNCPFRRMTQ